MVKDLAGWSHPEGCDQWLSVPMDIRDKWCPSGLHTGTTYSISSLMTPTKAAVSGGTKLSGVATTPEGWDGTQWDLDKLEKWLMGIS